jgi:aryl-alcohol dehydrogenase-like predicted oxidoreductase
MDAIPTRRLGDSDLEVSVVGLGCNNFGGRIGAEATRAVLDAALDAGITLLDTADVYGGNGGSETLIGELLGARRERVVLATKFGLDMGDGAGPRGSRHYVRQAAEASLRRLRTDVIDVYQYHRPDGVTPIEETLGALDELVREGKVRFIGCSNFSAAQLEEADRVARDRGLARFVSVQNEYSLLKRDLEADVLPLCERLGIGVLPYYPLARGLLTGKYRRGERAPAGTRLAAQDAVADDATFAAVERLEDYARGRGVGLLDVAFGGLLARAAVASVIAGATKPEQVAANVAAGRWAPSPADLEALPDAA